MSTNKFDWSVPQKLSPVALLLIIGKILKDSWPLVLIVVGRIIINEQEESSGNLVLAFLCFRNTVIDTIGYTF